MPNPKPKSIDDPKLYNKNAVMELPESRDKLAKSRIMNLDRLKQARKWLEKVDKS